MVSANTTSPFPSATRGNSAFFLIDPRPSPLSRRTLSCAHGLALDCDAGRKADALPHTMVRVTDVDVDRLLLQQVGLEDAPARQREGRFTLIFLAAPEGQGHVGTSRAPELELTYNWDPEDIYRRAQFRSPRLQGRRHLRDLPAADGHGRDDQPAAPRRQHGLRPLARQHLDRTAAGGRSPLPPKEPWARCRTPAAGRRCQTRGPALRPRCRRGACLRRGRRVGDYRSLPTGSWGTLP